MSRKGRETWGTRRLWWFSLSRCAFTCKRRVRHWPGIGRVKPKADAIYFHANVYTGVPASNSQFSSMLREEAIAVRGDRIQAVGKNVDIEKLKGPQTEVVDLGGHFVMPGFNDAHVHLADAGLQKLSVDLTGVKIAGGISRARAGQGGEGQAGRMDSGRRLGRDAVAGEDSAQPLGSG